ncbi:MAG: carbohydrate ABC transporter substrate-binding protein [Actinobacteria bacterium]|nr:carbohydrate ABC transporter substrate-binding protein [Actinomycetota bacterium]
MSEGPGRVHGRLTRRVLLRGVGAVSTTAAAAVVLAACGEAKVVTKEVPVEKVVVKEVPVEKVVTKEVEKVVTKEVPVEKIVTKTVEKIVEKIVTAPPQKATIRKLTAVTDWNDGPRLEVMNLYAAEYVKKFPHVQQVDIWHLGGGGGTTSIGLADAVITTMLVGQGPDVFIEFGERPTEWHADLTEWIKKLGIDRSKYIWQDASVNTKDGKPRFLPFNIGIPSFSYNLNMFQAAGVQDPPKDGSWTWTNWAEAFKKTTNKDKNEWGFLMTKSTWHWGTFDLLMAEGALPYDPAPALGGDVAKTRTTLFEDTRKWGGNPAQRWGFYVGLAQKDKVGAPASVQAQLQAGAGVQAPQASGKIAVWSGGLQGFGFQERLVGDRFKFGYAWPAMPEKTKRRSVISGHSGLSVNVQSRERGWEEEAVQLAALWLDEKIMGTAISTGAGGFMNKQMLRELPALKNAKAQRITDHALPICEWFIGPDCPWSGDYVGGSAWAGWREWFVALRGKMNLGIDGELSAEDALKQGIEAGDAAIKKVREQTK